MCDVDGIVHGMSIRLLCGVVCIHVAYGHQYRACLLSRPSGDVNLMIPISYPPRIWMESILACGNRHTRGKNKTAHCK